MINKLYKSALITGSANGIGYSILKRLVEDGIKVIAIDKDEIGLKKISKEFNVKTINLDLTNTKKLYKKFKFHHIFNFAAQAGVRYSFINPRSFIKNNISGCLLFSSINHSGAKIIDSS